MVYQSDPSLNLQGGGVRYVQNLTKGLLSKLDICVMFLGTGRNKYKKDNLVFVPITKNKSGYIYFLFKLIIKLIFLKLPNDAIIHVHRLYFAIPFILLKPNHKIICTLHGRTFSVFESNYGSYVLQFVLPLFKYIEIFCLKKIDYLIPVSKDVIESFQKKYTFFSEITFHKQSILPSMIQLSKFKPINSTFLQDQFGSNNKYLLFLGRLAEVKDIPFLFEMFKEFLVNNPNIKLIIAGAGELEKKLQELTNKFHPNKPIFLGSISSDKVPSLIASANMVLLCSKHEASPTVIKEALSCGVPVITSKVGDVQDLVVENKNGFVVEKKPEIFFSKINEILNWNLTQQDISIFSRPFLNVYTIESIIKRQLIIYEKIR